MDRLRDVVEEFRWVVLSRPGTFDAALPPVAYLAIRATLGFNFALATALILALIVGGLRLRRGQPIWFALGGVLGVLLAALLSRYTGSEAGYYLPGIASSGLSALLCLFSVLFRRPLVAWTSFAARRWPLAWYWHPKVRPAYSEVTLAWMAFFGLRTGLQYALYQQDSGLLLASMNFISGWPAIVVLLALSYLYGNWRLRHLGGPSVDEFKQSAPPPWEGQRRGF